MTSRCPPTHCCSHPCFLVKTASGTEFWFWRPSEGHSFPPSPAGTRLAAWLIFMGVFKRLSPGSAPTAAFKRLLFFFSVLISDSANRRGSSVSSAAPGARPTERPHTLLAFMTFNSRINEAAEEPLEVRGRRVTPANNRWHMAKVRRKRNLLNAEVSRHFLRNSVKALFSPARGSFSCLRLEVSSGLEGGGGG